MYKKRIIPIAILCIIAINSLNAQCNIGRSAADRLVGVLKTEKLKLVDNSKKLSTTKTMQFVKNNWSTITGKGTEKRGLKKLFLNATVAKDRITGSAKHTFISPPSEENKIKLALKRVGGKAKVQIYICVHPKIGTSEQRKNYVFESSTTSKSFIINNVQGKIISVTIAGKTKDKNFNYELKAKRAD